MTGARNRFEEHKIQCAIAEFLDLALRGVPAVWFAVPNGGARPTKETRNASGETVRFSPEAARLKKEGVKPGVADIIVYFSGLMIGLETKTTAKTSRLSKDQKDFRDQLEAVGGKFFVVRSIDDAAEALVKCGVPLKAHAGNGARPSQL